MEVAPRYALYSAYTVYNVYPVYPSIRKYYSKVEITSKNIRPEKYWYFILLSIKGGIDDLQHSNRPNDDDQNHVGMVLKCHWWSPLPRWQREHF